MELVIFFNYSGCLCCNIKHPAFCATVYDRLCFFMIMATFIDFSQYGINWLTDYSLRGMN